MTSPDFKFVKAQDLKLGVVYRRKNAFGPREANWRLCLCLDIEPGSSFVDVTYLSDDGQVRVWAYFLSSEMQVLEA